MAKAKNPVTEVTQGVRYLALVAGQQASVLTHGIRLFAGRAVEVSKEDAEKLRGTGLVQILEQPVETPAEAAPTEPTTPPAAE